MWSHSRECVTKTGRGPVFVDVTSQVRSVLDESGISDGHVTICVQDESCSLFVNELESGLLADLASTLQRLEPTPVTAAALGSRSVVVPAMNGDLRLGTWQRVMLAELDGGGERRLTVQIVGD